MDTNTYTSHAKWPEDAFSDLCNVTTDNHRTKEEARQVCRMLELDGFGGDKKIFPVETWVETTSDYPLD